MKSLSKSTEFRPAARSRRRRRWLGGGWLLLLVSAGCGGSPYELANVTGVVTIDGQPFHGGKVMFAPVATGESSKVGRPAFGLLGPGGEFVLSTYSEGDGAVVGEHWATLIQFPPEEQKATAQRTLPDFERVTFPQRTKVVAGQENAIKLDFTRDYINRFGNRRD